MKVAEPRADSTGSDRDDGPSNKGNRIVVLISDNLNSLEFQRDVNARPGQVGLLPKTLCTQLYAFQKEGFEWLQALWVNGAPGGLLGDDMGLGKTVQTLAFLAWIRELQSAGQVNHKPILIVGPTGLLRNWVAEHETHLRDDRLGELFEAHGSGIRSLRRTGSRSSELESGVPVLDVDLLAKNECVLTTYETLRDYQHSFAKVRWGVVVLDEVQKIKNPTSLVTEATKAMDADFTIALIGTPVENHLSDLWCVTDAVQPGRLGALKDFVNYYLPDGAVDQDRMRELKSLLIEHQPAPMLRRMKQDHLPGLPEISLHITRSEMPGAQAKAYDDVVAAARGAGGSKGGDAESPSAPQSRVASPSGRFRRQPPSVY